MIRPLFWTWGADCGHRAAVVLARLTELPGPLHHGHANIVSVVGASFQCPECGTEWRLVASGDGWEPVPRPALADSTWNPED